jgi:serine/threonine-protein kinase
MSEQPPSGSSPAVSSNLVGVVLDRYRIFKKLGEGGMGEVFAAEHVHLGKKRAIKLLRPEIVSNKEAVGRFYQEARSASSIGHKNIIGIEDFGELPDGRIFMVMELLDGAPLNDLIKQPMTVDRLLNILIQTGHGLAAAHQKGITHRDMKPENIYVTIGPSGEDIPKLLDFGIAKVAGNDGQNNLTKTGTIFGTPFYMAPEQALGQQVDARADVYAMGVIMYEVFSGSLPFQGESFMGILTQHITTEPEPVVVRAANAGRTLPPGLAEVIQHCMAKDPNRRYPTMDALVQALVEVYRAIAGAGMSSYMEAFAAPRTGAHTPQVPRTGPYGTPPPASQPTMVAGTGGMPQPAPGSGLYPPPPPPPGSGPVPMAGTPGSGLYAASGSGLVDVAPKKSKAGLIFALVAVLAAAGGITAFVVLGNKGEGTDPDPNGPGTGGVVTPAGTADAAPLIAPAGADAASLVAGGTPDAQVFAPPAPDAAPAPVVVLVDSKNVNRFEVWEGKKKLGSGAQVIQIVPGTPRTLVLKAKGYKDETVVIDGTQAKIEVKLESKGGDGPEPMDCSSKVKDPKNKKCVDQYCSSHPDDYKYCLD